MIRKLILSSPLLTRQEIADPHAHEPLLNRLLKAGATDLRSNVVVEDHANGYVTNHPVDPGKSIRR